MPLHASVVRGVSLTHAIPDGHWLFGDGSRVTSCCTQPTQCQPGDLFIALDELHLTSQDEIDIAIAQGASAILTERPLPNAIPQFIVPSVRAAFGTICHALSGNPSQNVQTVGVTGSYGKTTTSRLLGSIFQAAAWHGKALSSSAIEQHGALRVASWLADARAEGCRAAMLETSSQSLARGDLNGCQLDAAVITNLGTEHAKLHGSVENYHRAKARILEHLKPEGFLVVSADDPASRRLLDRVEHPAISVGIAEPAEITATILERHRSEQTFLMDIGDESIAVRTQIIGDGHVMSCLLATATSLLMGLDPATIVQGLEAVKSVPSRLQRLECGQPFSLFVDRADTPKALGQVVRTLRGIQPRNVHCVMGFGNHQSEAERAHLGRTLERICDTSVITSDRLDRKLSLQNAHDVLDGFDRPAQAHLMPDRAKAICWCLSQAQPGDVVLLAGGQDSLGPDETPLSDADVAQYWLHHQEQPSICPWSPA